SIISHRDASSTGARQELTRMPIDSNRVDAGAGPTRDGVARGAQMLNLRVWPMRLHNDRRTAFGMEAGGSKGVGQRIILPDIPGPHVEARVRDLAATVSAQSANRLILLAHDGGTHVGQRPFTGAWRVGMARPRIEARHAMTQDQTEPIHRH